eukprot:scaffold18712_cov118-Isochrysis_galbana.AAC.1
MTKKKQKKRHSPTPNREGATGGGAPGQGWRWPCLLHLHHALVQQALELGPRQHMRPRRHCPWWGGGPDCPAQTSPVLRRLGWRDEPAAQAGGDRAGLLKRGVLKRHPHAPRKQPEDGRPLHARGGGRRAGRGVWLGRWLRQRVQIGHEVPHVLRLKRHVAQLACELLDERVRHARRLQLREQRGEGWLDG